MSPSYDLHVARTWYLYCIGCDLLTRVQRTSETRRLAEVSELWFRSVTRPLLRITFCTNCATPLTGRIASAAWIDTIVSRTLIEESKLWQRVVEDQCGYSAPFSAMGPCFVVENPKTIILSTEFSYNVTDFGRDYCTIDSRYPTLRGRDRGRFHTLAWLDERL